MMPGEVTISELVNRVATVTSLPVAIVLEIVGGFSSLYLEKAMSNDGIFEMTTERGLVSKLFPSPTLIQEILNCSGMDEVRAERTLVAIESSIKAIFEDRGVFVEGGTLVFNPLGKLTVLDPLTSSYRVHYEDLARPDYPRFLLKHRK